MNVSMIGLSLTSADGVFTEVPAGARLPSRSKRKMSTTPTLSALQKSARAAFASTVTFRTVVNKSNAFVLICGAT